MRILQNIGLVLLLLLTGWGCRKDVDTFRPYSISVADITLALQQVPEPQSTSLLMLQNRQGDTVFTTPGGVRIFLSDLDHLFVNASGAVVPCSTCSDFRLEVVEVKTKGDLIARNTGTVTPGNQVLESGRVLHLKATCGGEELALAQDKLLKIQIPAEQPLIANQVFSNLAGTTNDNFTGWSGTSEPVVNAEWSISNGSAFQLGYQLFSAELQWICAGRLLEEANSSFCLELPLGFTNKNTKTFMVFKNISTVLPLTYDAADFRFCASIVPQGFPVQLLTISKLGNQYWMGYKDVETGASNSATIEPQKVTEQQVIDFVKNL
ncbi:MAG: hypothetical protein LCH81_08055 [Bacteroidetes bacterium]|nr:hypothetical protein [Bacteroidota bacterium]